MATNREIGKVNPNPLFNAQALYCFYYMALGSYTFVSERTPPGLSATAQAIYSTATFRLASITGSLIGGYLYDNVAMQNFFQIFSFLGLAGLAIFLMASKHKLISARVGEKQ